MISFLSKGNFDNVERLLRKSLGFRYRSVLEKYARQGVKELAAATPVDTGKTASSWDYEIVEEPERMSVHWVNNNVNHGVNIALILQYGHGTGTGGYVQGIDYINPALRPIFDEMADAAWKEVSGG